MGEREREMQFVIQRKQTLKRFRTKQCQDKFFWGSIFKTALYHLKCHETRMIILHFSLFIMMFKKAFLQTMVKDKPPVIKCVKVQTFLSYEF